MGLFIKALRVCGKHAFNYFGGFSRYFGGFSRVEWVTSYSAIVVAFMIVFLTSTKVHALGVGAAEADSYIGERLSVRIPLFNVSDPNSLSVTFSSPQFGRVGQSVVKAELDRSNSQLAIKLTSNTVINEPYLDFNLELSDDGTSFNKEFTVLLNLAPSGRVVPLVSSSNNFSVSGLSSSGAGGESRRFASGDLMGPYDYAQSGNIPARFGAVLDGQSLWRVARRINGAMGVSRSQMMWALYQANPSAFTSRSVQSLKAGSYLDIPSESVVKQTSHEQAKANLSSLSSGIPARQLAGSDNSSSIAEFAQVDAGDDKSNLNAANESQQVDPFQVASVAELGSQLTEADPQQAQQIIASLTETVGNLSQQLVRKDTQIESLEAQVEELRSFISEDADRASSAAVSGAVDTSGAQGEGSLPAEGSSSADGSTPAEGSTPIEQGMADASSNSALESANALSSVTPEPASFIDSVKPYWLWALACLVAVLLMLTFMRHRIASLWQSLNLFGSSERVEFNDPSIAEMPKVYSRGRAAFGSQPETQYQPSDSSASGSAKKDYSELVAVQKSGGENALSGISLDEDDDGSFEPNEILEFVTEAEVMATLDEEDLSFEERFNYLLDEKDFDFARELLDFARYNEINDERYHFERLRLFEKMGDEEEFYQYYYEIEDKIPAFPATVQTEISQLVVKIAHN